MTKKSAGIAVVVLIPIIISLIVVYFNLNSGVSSPQLSHKPAEKENSVREKKPVIKPVITESEVIKLAQHNMQTFAVSIKQKDMSAFYNNISPYWQERTTIEKLNETFNPFMKAGIDLTPLVNLQPILDKGTEILKNNDLQIIGHYNAKNAIVIFKQSYRFQNPGGWKAVGFFTEVKKKG